MRDEVIACGLAIGIAVAIALAFARGELAHRREVQDDEREHRQTMERIEAAERHSCAEKGAAP